MNRILIAIILVLVSSSSMAASKEPVRLKWSSNGLNYSSPLYRQQSSQFRSQYRTYENMPRTEVRKGFRKLDNAINKKLKSLWK